MTQRTCGSVWPSSGTVLRPKFSTLAFSSTACPFPSAWARGSRKNNQQERAPTRLRHFPNFKLIIQSIESYLLEFSLFLCLSLVFTGNRLYAHWWSHLFVNAFGNFQLHLGLLIHQCRCRIVHLYSCLSRAWIDR